MFIIIIILFFAFFYIFKIRANKKCKEYCFVPLSVPNLKIIHIIITRYLISFTPGFMKVMKTEEFMHNAKRVLNKYLS